MTAVALRPTAATALAHGGDMLSDSAQFELAQRWANAFAASQLVPAHLRGKPADCLIGMLMAKQLGDNPLMVLQNIYVVSGKAGWSANYMIARANAAGVFKGRITWDQEGAGKELVVTAKATLADTGEVVRVSASMQMAIAEGWDKNSKYRTMPEHMLRWRSATMLVRLYCPEVMLGMQTADELETDVQPSIAPPATVAASLDAFAGEAVEPTTEAEDPTLAAQPERDWSAYQASVLDDFGKHKSQSELQADYEDVKARLSDEDAPAEVRQAITNAYLEAQTALTPRRSR